jgi:methylmalonyl-CoA/ethylmalonyl-CoA epimerase
MAQLCKDYIINENHLTITPIKGEVLIEQWRREYNQIRQNLRKEVKMKKSSMFSNFHHVSLVVKDMDKAIAHFKTLGIGPFIEPPVKPIKEIWHGKPIPVGSLREVLGKMGEVWFQLCQPLGGDSPWQEFLDTKGEGVHHIALIVDDIEKAEAELTKKGIEIAHSARFEGGGGSCLADISKIGGILLEFIQRPRGVKD